MTSSMRRRIFNVEDRMIESLDKDFVSRDILLTRPRPVQPVGPTSIDWNWIVKEVNDRSIYEQKAWVSA